MKHTSQQVGFSAVIAVVAIMVVAILGFAAWRISQSPGKKATSNTSPASTPQNQNNTKSDPSEGGKYLVIKEWGVRFELPESLHGDVSYFMNARAREQSGGPVFASLTSKKFSAGGLKCAVIENNDAPRELLNLERQVNGQGGETFDPAPFKQINDARFYFLGTGCQEAIEREGSADDKRLISELKEAIIHTLQEE